MKSGISYAPALLAAGLMLVAWGVISYWPVAVSGLLLSVVALWKWIREVQTQGEHTK
jgi:hypothetical protein